MKTYTFKVTEHSLVGSKDREIDIKAKTEKSAVKKLMEICGNRSWNWLLTKVDGVLKETKLI